MNSKWYFLIMSAVIPLFLLVSCSMPSSDAPENLAIFTQAAQTIEANLTQAARSQLLTWTPTPTRTAPAVQPSSSPVSTPTPTQIVPPTASPTPLPTQTPTSTLQPCDKVQFVKDVTIPDGTLFTPGSVFTKIWRLKNTGSCTWTTDYDLVFVNGKSMGAPAADSLPSVITPGQTVDVSVDMKAPDEAGVFRGNFQLRNANGVLFGLGPGSNKPFWVEIEVIQPNSDYAYDFSINYCSATWASEAGSLSCPGTEGDVEGFVLLLQDPFLEDHKENEPTLWTRPENKKDGWISGTYPPYEIQSGDYFTTTVGCLRDSEGCDVIFQLDYMVEGGLVKNLGTWHEVYDKQVTPIEIDLSGLVGKTVQFILSVTNNGENPQMGNAFWFVPRIENK